MLPWGIVSLNISHVEFLFGRDPLAGVSVGCLPQCPVFTALAEQYARRFFELCLQLVMVSRIRPVICWDSRPLQMDTMAAPSTSFLINCVVIIIRNLETEHSKGTFKKPSTLMTQRGLTKPCWQPLERNALFGSMLKIERALLAERRRVWMVGDCVENGARVLPPC